MNKLVRRISGIGAALAIIGGAIAGAAPASAAIAQISTPATVASPQVINWTPYDYSHITTYQKCLNRMNYLMSVNPTFDHWRCMDYLTQTCPPKQYWMVEVGTNGYRVASLGRENSASPAEVAPAATCG